jgi:C4-dicarboxylate-specific signal transduction histidine kinase
MSSDSDRNFHEKQMEFFGAVTASVSHEINNVFAIMNENSGLMSDLLKNAKRDKPIDPKRFLRITETLGKQLDRGKHIVKRLNRFSHSVDTPLKEIDLNEIITNLCDISQRFAYRKKVELSLSLKRSPIVIESSPFTLQQMVFSCITAFLCEAQPSDSIAVKVRKDSDGAVILLYGPKLKSEELFAMLQPMTDELAAKTQAESEGAKILLFLPRSISA